MERGEEIGNRIQNGNPSCNGSALGINGEGSEDCHLKIMSRNLIELD
jgi:hypothetical protein